jgi:nucleoside-diphosphate-sugar epimerase
LKKTILLTGSSGFLGKIFLRESLKKNYQVIDILRLKNKKKLELNKLRKYYQKSYKSVFFKNNNDLKKKISNLKIDFFINFATLYKNDHTNSDINNFINSNITFPTIIMDIIQKKVKKVVNFGTMMQHLDGKNFMPKNFYASTKSALEMIFNYYLLSNKKLKLYNLKFYESFHEFDNRKKLIPILIKNYKKNLRTKIKSKNLKLNIIYADDIIKAIFILLNNNIKSGSYCLINKKNIHISNLIKKINKNLNKKIKIQLLNEKIDKMNLSKIKILDKWTPTTLIEQKITKIFKDEDYKNTN